MKLLALGLLAFIFSGCASQTARYIVHIHEHETKSNHYVIIQTINDANGGEQQYCYDCYSRPDSVEWHPTCKKIKVLDDEPNKEK
jgi:hypothetical protein